MLQPDDLKIIESFKQKNINIVETEQLCKIISNNYFLTVLDLSQIVFENKTFIELCLAIVDNTTITVLDFEWSNIGSLEQAALQGLKNVIQSHITLTSLNLSRNHIDDAHISEFISGIVCNTTLLILNLKRNLISKSGVELLLQTLQHNNTLVYLDIDNNKLFDDKVTQEIKSLIIRNQEHKNAFLQAAEKGDLENIIKLLDTGVSIFNKNDEGMSVLHLAAQNGFLNVVQYICENFNIDIRAVNQAKITTNELAKRTKHTEIVNYLTKFENSIVISKIHFTSSFYNRLLIKINYFSKILRILILSNCAIEIKKISQLSIILPNLQFLDTLNLNYNKICNLGFERLLQNLPKNLKNIYLLFNFIDYVDSSSTMNQLNHLKLKLHNHIKVNLSGNLFQSHDHIPELKKVIRFIFTKFNVSIAQLLECEFFKYTSNQNEGYTLVFRTKSGEHIEAILDHAECDAVSDLRKRLSCLTDTDLFSKLFEMRYNSNHLANILNFNLFGKEIDDNSNISVSKKLLDAHPNAPLKSYLITNSIFQSVPLNKINCLLLPKLAIDKNQGIIYIIAKKPKNGEILAEHAWLAYEYLTKYGQRFFKVANLTTPINGYWEHFKNLIGQGASRPEINFFLWDGSALKTVEYLTNNCIIAGFITDRGCLKELHKSVLDDIKNFSQKYKTIMSSVNMGENSNRSKEIVNCVKWTINKIETHLNISIPESITGIFIPSTVVNNLIQLGEPVNLSSLIKQQTMLKK